MALTRDFKRTVSERIARDPSFARALLDEAASLFLNGEPETARLTLRELVNATVGFERLSAATGRPAKSLHRMLSATGNPSMRTYSHTGRRGYRAGGAFAFSSSNQFTTVTYRLANADGMAGSTIRKRLPSGATS
jgi:DNA-binding phage protein